MTHFWMPADGALATAVTDLEAGHATLELDVLRKESTGAAMHYLDAVVEGLVLGPITEGVPVSAFTERMMRTVASVVESIAGRLVKSTLKKAPQSELVALVHFLSAHVERSPAGAVINVALDDTTTELIALGVASVHAEEFDAARPLLTTSLQGVTSCSMRQLYDEPFTLLTLGGLTGRAVRAGSGTIESGAHSAIERSVRNASPDELRGIAGYVHRRSNPPGTAEGT